jgi:hypothetical protein
MHAQTFPFLKGGDSVCTAAMQKACVHSYHAHAGRPSLMKGMLDLLPLFLICLKNAKQSYILKQRV